MFSAIFSIVLWTLLGTTAVCELWVPDVLAYACAILVIIISQVQIIILEKER